MLTSIVCEACPAGQFPGEGWECKVCDDFSKEYIETSVGSGSYTCQCKGDSDQLTGFKSAGSSCVAKPDYDILEDNVRTGGFGESKVMRYKSLVDKNGNPAEDPDAFES